MKIPRLPLIYSIMLSLIFGFIAGIIDLFQSEVQPAVFIVSFFSFVSGLLKPKSAWLSACIIGSGVFFAHFIANALDVKVSFPPKPGIGATLIAIIPAMLSAYLGSLTWFFFHRKGNDGEHSRG